MKKVAVFIAFILYIIPGFSQQIVIDKNISMLALGDSYTIGQSVNTEDRWPHQLIDELLSLGVTANYPDYIATTGWTTRSLILGINALLDEEKEYDLVSILIGVNNQYQGIDIASYEPDLRTIVDRALGIVGQDTSSVFILSIPDYAFTPFGNGNEMISQEIDAYNSIKRSVAMDYGIVYIDITAISRNGLNNPSLVASDGLHPSAKQYTLWMQNIIPRMNLDRIFTSTATGFVPNEELNVFPNPVRSQLQINSSSEIKKIRIYDINGRLLMEQTYASEQVSLDIGSLADGAYALLIYTQANDGRVIRKTILKQAD